MTWLTKELMLQYMVWYLDMHTAKNLFDLAEVAVVFKNIAPILVALKIDKEKKLLQRIVDNCEGKTIGELMGWIQKARRGELHLNKLEIEKWSNKHGII